CIEPPAFPEIKKVELGDDLVALVIQVTKGISKPYIYYNRPYQRVGSTTRSMPQSIYEKILIERLHAKHRWENQPAGEEISIKDLDEEEIQLTVDNAIDLG